MENKICTRKKNDYEKNRDHYLEYKKIYYQKNKIEFTKKCVEWKNKNIDKVKEYKKKWGKRNPEGMSWENYGLKGWHIDHIKPCCCFDLTDPNEQKKCFHFSNLQPLWAIDNLRKGGKFAND